MKLPPHTATPSGIRGYDRIDWVAPSRVESDAESRFARIRALAAAQAALKPWTLVPMPGESFALVARSQGPLMRLWTWWLNRSRRRIAADMRRRMAVYFAPEQVAARVKASQ